MLFCRYLSRVIAPLCRHIFGCRTALSAPDREKEPRRQRLLFFFDIACDIDALHLHA